MTETAQVCIRSPWGNRDHVRNTVGVPALKMVDDVVDIKKCGIVAIKSTAGISLFMEPKKLTFSKSKCHKIHCGKKTQLCPDLKYLRKICMKTKKKSI